MRSSAKRYTDDLKKMIVEVYDTGKSIKEICEEYGLNYGTINNWGTKANGSSKKISEKPLIKTTRENKKAVKEAENEVLRLKKQIKKIEMENEILHQRRALAKKAIAIFTQDNKL